MGQLLPVADDRGRLLCEHVMLLYLRIVDLIDRRVDCRVVMIVCYSFGWEEAMPWDEVYDIREFI